MTRVETHWIEFAFIGSSIHTSGIKNISQNIFSQNDNNKTKLYLFDQSIKIYNRTWYVDIAYKLKKKLTR